MGEEEMENKEGDAVEGRWKHKEEAARGPKKVRVEGEEDTATFLYGCRCVMEGVQIGACCLLPVLYTQRTCNIFSRKMTPC